MGRFYLKGPGWGIFRRQKCKTDHFCESRIVERSLKKAGYWSFPITWWDNVGMSAAKVLLADDHVVVRAGLRNALASLPDLEIAGEVGNGHELAEH